MYRSPGPAHLGVTGVSGLPAIAGRSSPMWHGRTSMATVFTMLGVSVVLFVTNRVPVEIVVIGVALSFATTGAAPWWPM